MGKFSQSFLFNLCGIDYKSLESKEHTQSLESFLYLFRDSHKPRLWAQSEFDHHNPWWKGRINPGGKGVLDFHVC